MASGPELILTDVELRCCLELVNKVYRRDKLSFDELNAIEDLINRTPKGGSKVVVTETDDKNTSLARAISCSVNDPLWRECLELVSKSPIANQNPIG